LTEPTPPRRQADALRAAIDRTMSSLGERSPASAAKLPAELASRTSQVVDEVARRGLDAIDASTALTARVLDAVSDTLRRNSQRRVEGE
jgi:hypothetical protein